MKLYLAGPMRGYGNYNFQSFFFAEAMLRMRGHEVENPARMDIEEGKAAWIESENRIAVSKDFTIEDALRRDILAMAQGCEGIVLLPGWEKSEGANKELDFARTIGLLEYLYFPARSGELVPNSKSIQRRLEQKNENMGTDTAPDGPGNDTEAGPGVGGPGTRELPVWGGFDAE